jgi:hypothetical protein
MPDQGQPQQAVRDEWVRFPAGWELFLDEHDPQPDGVRAVWKAQGQLGIVG